MLQNPVMVLAIPKPACRKRQISAKVNRMFKVRQNKAILMGGATLAGGAAWWISHVWEAHAGHATLLLRIGAVFLPMAAAGVLYYGVTLWWKVRYAEETLGLFLGKLRKLRGV